MASKLYGQFLSQALNKEIDWDTDTIKVALLSNSYTPDQDAHNYLDDVVTYEVTGTGYTAGGNTLANKTNTYNSATNVIVLDADDTTWSSSTITARYAVIYDASPSTNATKPLIGYVDFGSDQSSSNGNFTITWDATGIVRITVA
jgi:hypothetical protein